MTPFVKWAGGKSQLLTTIIDKFPKHKRYFEPFVGGGAVVFSASCRNAYINDCNAQLINTYLQLRDNSSEFLEIISELDNEGCNKEIYLARRSQYNKLLLSERNSVLSAVLFVWLNKHCFNGLYRVNSKGMFNVPYNNKTSGASVDPDNIKAISSYLSNVTISCLDFEDFCHSYDIGTGDLIYFDSPYIPMSRTADFTSYTENGFRFNDHRRLSVLFRQLDSAGASIILSNNDTPLTYELYFGYNITSFEVRRAINRNASGRYSREVLITNFNLRNSQ